MIQATTLGTQVAIVFVRAQPVSDSPTRRVLRPGRRVVLAGTYSHGEEQRKGDETSGTNRVDKHRRQTPFPEPSLWGRLGFYVIFGFLAQTLVGFRLRTACLLERQRGRCSLPSRAARGLE